MFQAVVAVIPSCHIKYSYCNYLAVPRRDNTNLIGMVGGKVDENESLIDAIKRECLEETGVEILDLVEIFKEKEFDYLTTTFLARSYKMPSVLSGDTGVPLFVSKDKLTDLAVCPFSEYNKKVFSIVDSLKLNDDYFLIL